MGSGFDFRKSLKMETARQGVGALLRGVLLGSIMEVQFPLLRFHYSGTIWRKYVLTLNKMKHSPS